MAKLNFKKLLCFLVFSLLFFQACDYPVEIENDFLAEKNSEMVKNLISDYRPSSAVIYMSGERNKFSRNFQVEGIFFVDFDNNGKYNLALLKGAEYDETENVSPLLKRLHLYF